MEPRVSNLLLAEQSPADRHEIDIHAISGNPTGAVFPSTTLPAIRPLHEDQFLDARPYTNEIDSLTLPEIDWQALTTSLNLPQSVSNNAIPQNVQGQAEHPTTQAKKPTKSGAPIAEVLNQVSPDLRNAQRIEELPEPEPRKRRRLEAPVTRTLPRPSPAAKRNSKRHFLPPLLVPLHEPPPNAGLIPSMTTEGLKAHVDKVPSREALRAENQAVTISSIEVVTEHNLSDKPEPAKSSQAVKSRRARQNWSKEETSNLLRGVARFGIGSWKKILDCPEYKFQNRTAVDLKDRFRTCCPDEYKKGGTEKVAKDGPSKNGKEGVNKKPKRKDGMKSRESEKSSKFEHKLPDELARLGISGPFPKANRRARRGFTAEEDEAILRGFENYGAKWTKIQSDPELDLSSRSRTDLRDRFRNKYPEKFIETGHKFDKKDGKVSKEVTEAEKEDQITTDQAPSLSASQTNVQQAPLLTVQDLHPAHHSLKLLTASMAEPNYFPDFGDLTPDAEEPGPITLSRNIFDWADQNTRGAVGTTSARYDTNAPTYELSSTITTMDQFHMNPMLALKVPHQTQPSVHTGARDGTVAGPSNLFPQLPLSGILNGPVSLPSAAELVSGLESEGNL